MTKREQDRRYRAKYPDKGKNRCRKNYIKNREKILKKKKEYADKNKEKISMWNKLNYLKRKGIIEIVKCQKCGIKEDLVMHHEDYDKPFKIMVLCRGCHNKVHKLIT